MKKILLMLVMLILLTQSVFATSLDEKYVDLLYSKFSDLSADEVSLLQVALTTDTGLSLLYLRAVEEEEKLAQYGITKQDVQRNIDVMRTWSVEDRLALLAAAQEGNRSKIDELNSKNANTSASGEVLLSSSVSKNCFINGPIEVNPALKDKQFMDTANHWSKSYVLYLVERGIISGRDEFRFDPDASITKAEVVTLLTKLIINDLSALPTYTGDSADITAGAWYDGHMQRGEILGIVTPNEMGLFEPNHDSTREEVVTMLINALKALDIELDDNLKNQPTQFKDFNQVNESHKEDMAIAINLGFISGKGNQMIDPKSKITRAEIAVVIQKIYLYILDNI